MSDCSTQAMMPKEPPRTCGNWMLTYYDQHGYEHGYGIKRIPELPAYFQATDDNSQKQLRYYADKGRTELEQRYRQLEQVARDMLGFIKGIEREYPHLLDPNKKPGGQLVYPMPSEDFGNRLRELGVDVDD